MTEPALSRVLETREIHQGSVLARVSAEVDAPPWDRFLRGVSEGQFQQSSLWAQSKRSEGWQCLRATLERENEVVAGFQILWRKTRFGKLGYISKGPVVAANQPELESFALDVLMKVVSSEGLAGIIAQPPDVSPALVRALEQRGFAPDRLMAVMDASLWIDLSGPPGAWEEQMRAKRRAAVRRALKSGVTTYQGSETDVPLFFELMSSSCRRQGVRPNPPTLEATTQLVRAFTRTGEARMTFAVCEGQPVAAVFDLKFGHRYTTWKKGWNGQHGLQRPNVFLTYDSIRKAAELGCAYFDFGGIDRSFAEVLIAGQELTEVQQNHYDTNKLGFGGEAKLLPAAMIYFRNPLIRSMYRQIKPELVAWLKRPLT